MQALPESKRPPAAGASSPRPAAGGTPRHAPAPPSGPSAAPEEIALAWIEAPAPVGRLLASVRGGRLCALSFDGQVDEARGDLVRRFGAAAGAAPVVRPGEQPTAAAVQGALGAWFAGDLFALDALAVDTGGTEFQQRVWTALRRIPPGETRSYAWLAAEVGSPKAVRAVGLTNGRNPVPLVIPCHRVIGKDGSLTGYGGGLARKRWLLDHERASARRTPANQ